MIPNALAYLWPLASYAVCAPFKCVVCRLELMVVWQAALGDETREAYGTGGPSTNTPIFPAVTIVSRAYIEVRSSESAYVLAIQTFVGLTGAYQLACRTDVAAGAPDVDLIPPNAHDNQVIIRQSCKPSSFPIFPGKCRARRKQHPRGVDYSSPYHG